MYKYQQIANQLRQAFTTGAYAPGAMLPDQEALAKTYHTTRITIRKALQLLIVEGVVYSKRGSGTFLRKDFKPDDNAARTTIDDPLGTTATQRGHQVTSKVLEFAARMPAPDEQEALLIGASDPVYVIRRVRYVDGKIFSYEHTIMPTKVIALTEAMLEGSIYRQLHEAGIRVAGSHRRVYAIKATTDDVEALGATLNDPVLVIKQTSYTDEGEPFEYSESHFPYATSSDIADVEIDPLNQG